jgi:glyoxylase-like metal-dependent hydrolase (beta-lactamase superfamily II)
MIVEQLRGRFGDNFAYVVADDKTKEGLVIDPSGLTSKILGYAAKQGIRIIYVINTHRHGDHTGGNAEIAGKTGAKIVKHASSASQTDAAVKDGDILKIGELEARIIHTPGHSPDGISILIGKNLFTGDTLFIGECGRTDLPGGSSEQLWDSLLNKISKLDDDIEVYPGHDYGPLPHDSLGNQKRTNYTLERRTLEEFIQFMLEP